MRSKPPLPEGEGCESWVGLICFGTICGVVLALFLAGSCHADELPPLPPEPIPLTSEQHEALIIAAEIPVAIDVGTGTRRIHKNQGVFAWQHDTKLLVWTDAGLWRELVLTNWDNYHRGGGSDFAISGNRLVVSGQGLNFTPNDIYEFALTDWTNGLPARAVPVTKLKYSTWDGRDTAALTTSSGAIMVATVRHSVGGWQNDIAFCSSGKWSIQQRDYAPPDSIPSFQINAAQSEDGRIVILLCKDSGSAIKMARWVERGEQLVYDDFDTLAGPWSGQLAPDHENPWVSLDWPLMAYQSASGSKMGCVFRLAREAVAKLSVEPQLPRPPITSWAIDQQLVYLSWPNTPGVVYRPEGSTNLQTWVGIQVWEWDVTDGQNNVIGFTPYYSVANPAQSLFLSVKVINYRLNLVELLTPYVERANPSCKLVRRNDGVLDYFLAPMDEPDCPFDIWYRTTMGTNIAPPPIDYKVLAYGAGWVVIQRPSGYFLKRIA